MLGFPGLKSYTNLMTSFIWCHDRFFILGLMVASTLEKLECFNAYQLRHVSLEGFTASNLSTKLVTLLGLPHLSHPRKPKNLWLWSQSQSQQAQAPPTAIWQWNSSCRVASSENCIFKFHTSQVQPLLSSPWQWNCYCSIALIENCHKSG